MTSLQYSVRHALILGAIPAVLFGALGCAGASQLKGSPDGEAARASAQHFHHAGCSASSSGDNSMCGAEFTRTIANGHVFDFVIEQTDTVAFTYVISGVVVPSSNDSKTRAAEPRPATDVKTLWQVHDRKYGGYIIEIRKKEGQTSELHDANIRVNVRTAETKLGFGGGFTISGLVDPVYGSRVDTIPPTAAGTGQGTAPVTQTTLVEAGADRSDKNTRGVASFVHVWHTAVPALALSFGLGLDQTRGANYYLGPSIRFGDKAYLTAGPAWGSVRTLPPGATVGKGIDPSILNSLPNRTARSWVVAISYGFIGGAQDALAKPFAGEAPSTPPNSGTTAGKAQDNDRTSRSNPPAAPATPKPQ